MAGSEMGRGTHCEIAHAAGDIIKPTFAAVRYREILVVHEKMVIMLKHVKLSGVLAQNPNARSSASRPFYIITHPVSMTMAETRT